MASAGPPKAAGDRAQPALRALVVDDVVEICNLYRALFQRIRGMDVSLTVETDPKEAIRHLREEHYDLVISDFRMKEADGVEVLSVAHHENPAGRRVLMTGYNEIPTSIGRIRNAHIDAYVQKPLKTQDLLIMVSDILAGDEARIAAHRMQAQEIEQIALREEQISATVSPPKPPEKKSAAR
ncbi:MAG: response regulator [Candidatus Thermoplasmatota archaeon]